MRNIQTHPNRLTRLIATASLLVAITGAPASAEDPTSATAEVTSEGSEATAAPSNLSASVTAATSIGIGTFVEGPQKRELIVGSLSPRVAYKLGDAVSISGVLGVTWYALESAGVGFAPNRVLLGSASATLSDGSIWADKERGLTLSGSFTVVAPTSLSDQLTNKIFSMTPSFALSWKEGDFSLSGNTAFSKAFNRTNQATLDCSSFSDQDECLQGRLLSGSLTSESVDGEVVLTGTGLTSFAVVYGLSAGYAAMDGLNINLGLSITHAWGVMSLPEDSLASVNAKTGRSQSDALTSSLSVSYQALKQLSVGLSLATSTARPLGAQGDDIVIFDFTRASDNITSIGLSVTGSM
jgi:hypothetical protein